MKQVYSKAVTLIKRATGGPELNTSPVTVRKNQYQKISSTFGIVGKSVKNGAKMQKHVSKNEAIKRYALLKFFRLPVFKI